MSSYISNSKRYEAPPDRRGSDQRSYLFVLLLTTGVLFAGAWILTTQLRRGFLEIDYGAWQAKLGMIDRCDLGDIAILGDSRASIGFIPRYLPALVSNFALTGTGPVEADFEFRRMLRCRKIPKTVILSFSPEQFESMYTFWSRSARFGLFTYADLEEIRRAEQAISPGLLYAAAYGGEPPGPIKNWMYINHFPPYEFGNLIGAAVVGRIRGNTRAYREALRERGQYANPPLQTCAERPIGDSKPAFTPLPLIDHYYAHLLENLRSHGVHVVVIATPISEISATRVTGQYEQEFAAYLAAHGSDLYRTPAAAQLFPVLPNCDFADDVHLNQSGAVAFSVGAAKSLARDLPL